MRTVCFNPTNDLVLLSGGQIDKDIKVWNSETGKNVANLAGHSGDIHAVKMASDGSFAISVSTDKKILLFDIRCQRRSVRWTRVNILRCTTLPCRINSSR